MDSSQAFEPGASRCRNVPTETRGQPGTSIKRTEANAPYSGKDGLIYSAARHGNAAGIPYLEIELRQDLIASERSARAIAGRVARALDEAAL